MRVRPSALARPGAVVRGVGVALACLVSDTSKRSPILLAAYTGGWFLNKPGLRLLFVVPDADEPWKAHAVPFVTSVATWSAATLVATSAVRRTRLPTPIGAVVLGAAFMVADSVLADLADARDAAKAAAAEGDGEASR